MSIDAIQFIPPGIGLDELTGLTAQSNSSVFADWLSKEMNEVNSQIQNAESLVQQFAIGSEDNLHQVMISAEKAKLSFELALQVRNKLLEGYQEIMRMQI